MFKNYKIKRDNKMKNKQCYTCKYYNKKKNTCYRYTLHFESKTDLPCVYYEKYEKYHRSPKEDRTNDGIVFDSKKEMKRYCILKLLEKNGEIQNLELQPVIELQESFKYDDKTIRAIQYKADFKYNEGVLTVIEDVKGMKTKEYIIKKKLLLMQIKNDPMIEFRET